MRQIMIWIGAGIGAFCSLFKARAKVVALSANGHEVLQGWPDSPDESIISLAEREVKLRNDSTMCRAALYCFEGPHVGELFRLSAGSHRLGCDSEASVVVTPGAGVEVASFRLLASQKVTLTSESAVPFLLNGCEEHRAELFDYDELAVLGNRYVVMLMSEVTRSVPSRHSIGKELGTKEMGTERTKKGAKR